MNKSSTFLTVLGLLSSVVFAYDSDPGYGSRGETPAVRGKARSTGPAYYLKPTMRYYGKGYTVTYRYVQWSDRMNRAGTTVYEGAKFNLPAAAMQPDGVVAPRIVYQQGAQQSAQAPRSVVTAPAKEVPPIAGSETKKQ